MLIILINVSIYLYKMYVCIILNFFYTSDKQGFPMIYSTSDVFVNLIDY